MSKIKNKWKSVFEDIIENNRQFFILKFKASVSSGTYIRVLAPQIAKELFEVSGFVYSLKRKKIGKLYKIFGFSIWVKIF